MTNQPARVTGLLLAAGAGLRAGGPKALRQGRDGARWLPRTVQTLLDGGCDQVVVVLGAQAERARGLLPAELLARGRVVVVTAPNWSEGLGRSLLAGLSALPQSSAAGASDAGLPDAGSPDAGSPDSGSSGAVLVHLVDLPDVDDRVVRRVVATASQGPATLARACYHGRPGHPVLVGADHLEPLRVHLLGRHGPLADVGASVYLGRHRPLLVECGDLAGGRDQDLSD